MLTFKLSTMRTAPGPQGRRCLIIGAGSAGRSLARELKRSPAFGLRPVGFLDDHVPPRGLQRVTSVLGRIDDLPTVAAERGVDVAIIAIPSLPPDALRTIAEKARAAGLTVRYLPSFLAALERDMRVTDLRTLNMDNLLGRQERHVVRRQSRAALAGKRVLVTGAGGSIGSALCRQVSSFEPARLLMLDHDESNLHRVQLELTGEGLLDSDDIIIADIRDRERVRQLFGDLAPEVVFHAAAHKHLPLLERHPCEGVKSNVVGTANLVDAAVETGAERFILISTDKAADPTSILGATKRMAELIVAHRVGGDTRLASVRFGNVLGSRGSLLSVLSEQFQSGQPVTVTAPDVTRFFMTIDEAAGLVIEAAEMADVGEIFVLDMGEPVRIVDLVRNYAAELHLDEGNFDITFTGLRPGEKLNEALFSDAEERFPTAHPRIFAALPRRRGDVDFDELLEGLVAASARNDAAETRTLLGRLLPDYTPPPVLSSAGRGRAVTAPYADDY
jgi:FlaA1/EpsC-like NDP-sugar epimerase